MRISKYMRWRAVAVVLLFANLGLAAGWWFSTRQHPINSATSGDGNLSVASARTNFVVRRQIFSWKDLESPDYPTYILNLRNIGCPEQTVRDIIIADVNALYSLKRATNLVTSEQQ